MRMTRCLFGQFNMNMNHTLLDDYKLAGTKCYVNELCKIIMKQIYHSEFNVCMKIHHDDYTCTYIIYIYK